MNGEWFILLACGAAAGVRLCHSLDVTRLKRVFTIFLLLIGLKMVFF